MSMRRGVFVVLVLALSAAVAAMRLAADDADAAQAAWPAPSRIISLVPALTEMVFAIGAGDRVIAVSSYDDTPPAVRTLPRVGALLDPDVERIIAMRADLVLLYGSQSDLIQQLTRASIPYFEYRHGGLSDVTETIRTLGERVGRGDAARAVARDIDERLGALARRHANAKKPRTLLVFGRDRGTLRNIYASGGRGFLHDMLEIAGGTNVFADIDAESVQASSELILTRAPEVIIELRPTGLSSGSNAERELSAWRALASVPAVRDGRVHLLPGRTLVVPGPGVADSAEALARAIGQ